MTALIDGVQIYTLQRQQDSHGVVLHMLRADVPHFERFGHIYFSGVQPGVTKAWRRHRRITSFLAVPCGELRLGRSARFVSSGRLTTSTLDETNYVLVRVPPGMWTGW